MSPASRLFPRRRALLSLSLLALPLALHGAQASFSSAAPAPGPYDIANLTGAAQDRDNIAGDGINDGDVNDHATYVSGLDRPHQGQTFTTGDNPAGYQVRAVWIKHAGYSANQSDTWWSAPAGSDLTIRLTRPAAAGTFAFALASEPLTLTGNAPGAPNAFFPVSPRVNTADGSGVWLRIGLESPVSLYPNTRYGFDLTGTSPELFFEWLGLRDNTTEGDAYPSGSAYVGSTTAVPDQTLRPLAGDRVFLVEMSPAVEVARDGAEVFLSWGRIPGAVQKLELYRGDRPSPENRRRIAELAVLAQVYLDKLPRPDATCWYWLVVTRPDGTTETIGPVDGRAAPAWTP
jgi:hypothetical protein